MGISFDENGPTVVGNKIMVSGTWAAFGGTANFIIDVSPYMNVIV